MKPSANSPAGLPFVRNAPGRDRVEIAILPCITTVYVFWKAMFAGVSLSSLRLGLDEAVNVLFINMLNAVAASL
jgi:hypothetical protein